MTDKLLLDSNIIIYLQKNILSLDDIPRQYTSFCVSAINYMEVMGYVFGDEQEKQAYEAFFTSIEILPIDENVIQQTIKLKQQSKRKLLDTIIASTAIVHDCTLATRNVADFKNLPVTLFNPFDSTS